MLASSSNETTYYTVCDSVPDAPARFRPIVIAVTSFYIFNGTDREYQIVLTAYQFGGTERNEPPRVYPSNDSGDGHDIGYKLLSAFLRSARLTDAEAHAFCDFIGAAILAAHDCDFPSPERRHLVGYPFSHSGKSPANRVSVMLGAADCSTHTVSPNGDAASYRIHLDGTEYTVELHPSTDNDE